MDSDVLRGNGNRVSLYGPPVFSGTLELKNFAAPRVKTRKRPLFRSPQRLESCLGSPRVSHPYLMWHVYVSRMHELPHGFDLAGLQTLGFGVADCVSADAFATEFRRDTASVRARTRNAVRTGRPFKLIIFRSFGLWPV